MTDTVEDLLFFKLKDLITEQSEGEWTDTQIFADAIRFANALRPMLAASPQGEGSSGDTTNMIAPVEAVAWRDIATAPRQEPVLVGHSGFLGWRRLAICNALGEWSYCDRPWLQQDPLDETPTHWHPLPPPPSAHPAPIKPSGDTGELRERVARIVDPAGFDDRWDVPGLRHEASLDERVDEALAKADAILDLIQSERAG